MVKKQPVKRRERKIDVGDVEDAMEDDRRIMKMYGKKATGEADVDGELFTVDTKGSFEGISKSSRRELARAKLFPPKGKNIGMSSAEEGKVVRAERQVEATKRPVPPKAPEVFDLWGTPATKIKPNAAGFNRVITRMDNKMPKKAPGTLHQKVGLAPAVLPAHEGQSVNPHREAYEDLACMAAAAELEREREVDEINRKLKPMTHELIDAVGKERLKDMDEEEQMRLYRSLHGRSAGAGKEGVDGDNTTGQKKWKQKSSAYRNKKKKRTSLDSQLEQAKAQQRLDKSVGQVPSMLKGMQEEDEQHKKRKQYKEALRAKRKELEATAGVVPKKRKIGGGQYVEGAAIVPDAESGAKGLRSMPLRASAVRERLESVVRRGLLPPPSEATKQKQHWHKRKNNKLKRGRKFISPLLKDNLLLR